MKRPTPKQHGRKAIELRWLEKDLPIPYLGDNIIRKVRTLQYRAQVLQMHQKPREKTDDGALIMCEVPAGYGWTDWQDVPTVDACGAQASTKEE